MPVPVVRLAPPWCPRILYHSLQT